MSTHRVLVLLSTAALVAAVAGCSGDKLTNTGLTPDEAAVRFLIVNAPELNHDVVSHTVPDTTAASLAAAERYFWWRSYNAPVRQIDLQFIPSDSVNPNPRAAATITTTFTGTFHVVHRDAGGLFTRTDKPLVDVFTQTAGFEQLFSPTGPNRGWVLKEISNIVGASNPTTLSIRGLTLDAASSPDRAFTPASFSTAYLAVDRWTLRMDERVNILVESGSGTNRVFRHDWYSTGIQRVEVINQDLGYYSDQMTTPASLTAADAARSLVIDVIADGVINGAAAYDAFLWAVPYRVNVAGTPN